ncbi:MAG: ABC transporter ATP-binding protein [Microcystaceae cyanobacterium]
MTATWAIATQGLTKQFERQRAVNNVDLQVEEGAVYGLIGPNGAGKTTLMRMLAMAESATIGEIHLFGDRLIPRDSNLKLKQYLGYLPDDFPLYDDLSVWDYLDYFARLYFLKQPHRRRRLEEVLELVQLTSKRRSRISTLSRGMKQRLSLARTIIHEPLLLLLDEPVSGLDPLARMQFREIIKVLQAAGMTVFISSHVLSDLAELCTAIGIMELGCLVESSDLQTLYQRRANQQIQITVLENMEGLIQEVKQFSKVISWEKQADSLRLILQFTGDSQDSAELLRSLIIAGLAVTDFHVIQEDLESIFLKLGHQQVS